MQHGASTNSSEPTFAEKTAGKIQPLINFEHLTEEQGIIFFHIEGTKIRDYLVAIHQLVGGAANIVSAFRVSGGKVIIFLAKKETVDYFLLNHGGFQLNQTFIKTSKIKNSSKINTFKRLAYCNQCSTWKAPQRRAQTQTSLSSIHTSNQSKRRFISICCMLVTSSIYTSFRWKKWSTQLIYPHLRRTKLSKFPQHRLFNMLQVWLQRS